MGRIAKETAGQVICFIGLIGVCIVCGIPMWRVTSYIGANIVTGQIVWDGLWMNCVMQSTGQMQCSIHQSLLRLSRDLQAARALIVSSIVVAFLGVMLTFVGAKCTSCLKQDGSKAKVVILGGVICIVAGVICLIPICWSAATTISDFINPLLTETQKRELGAAIYIGWATSGLLIIGGAVLCTSCPPQDYKYYPAQYSYPGSIVSGRPYIPGPEYAPGSQYAPAPQYMPAKPVYAPPPGSQYTPAQYL
ncbi:claudin-like protein ZF-A89 [Megalops cyprinoides]|uniref:claudin-like protein ZF-A89 n=1 Tax=Megalops cyprinoides TaxID=118141 RepID=UPI0018653F36|nr:claudin-like protein ZF-A89 [Megalops cyprinoides]